MRHHGLMTETADVIVVGAGVQGASLAFHLARRGARVLVLERDSVAAGATGRSSGFVRMHYDLESDARLAWASLPYFEAWAELVGAGDCGFVRTGFMHAHARRPRRPRCGPTSRSQQAIGIDTQRRSTQPRSRPRPGRASRTTSASAAYEPRSGYADPSGHRGRVPRAAARRSAPGSSRAAGSSRSSSTARRSPASRPTAGRFDAPVVVDVAGAWAAGLARTVGVEVPVETWRHDTAFFGLPAGRGPDFPIVIDEINQVYFRPEGRDIDAGRPRGRQRGRRLARPAACRRRAPAIVEDMVTRVCARVPWMADGTLRTAHGGQDGITTADQRPILGRAGPDGFYLACGFSGTGFKTAPAIGAA